MSIKLVCPGAPRKRPLDKTHYRYKMTKIANERELISALSGIQRLPLDCKELIISKFRKNTNGCNCISNVCELCLYACCENSKLIDNSIICRNHGNYKLE